MDKKAVKDALETINDAILELNEDKTTTEDFYWWNAVLGIFDLQTDNGNIVLANYPKGSYGDRHRFFTEWG